MLFDPNTVITYIQNFNILLFFKVIFLIFIGLYTIFAFMLYNKIRSLEKISFFPTALPDYFIKEAALLYFLLILSLFFAALVIV